MLLEADQAVALVNQSNSQETIPGPCKWRGSLPAEATVVTETY